MQRTIQELNWESWLELDETLPLAEQVMSSRSFGERVESLPELKEAIGFHAANPARRLRKQKLLVGAFRYLSRTARSTRQSSMAELRRSPCPHRCSAACKSQKRHCGC
jgi:hypothetical protein